MKIQEHCVSLNLVFILNPEADESLFVWCSDTCLPLGSHVIQLKILCIKARGKASLKINFLSFQNSIKSEAKLYWHLSAGDLVS